MNTIYKTALLASIVGIGSIPLKSIAQTAVADSILNPHINVERQYTPIIKDATKINTIPERHEVEADQYPIIFENAVPLLKNLPHSVADLGAGDIQTDINFNKHRGYLTLGAGTRLNLEGNAGYRIVETSKDQLDLFGTHNSTSGNVDFLDPNPLFKKTKAKNIENFVKAKYSHQFATLSWYLSASFLNNGFNYYGNPYWNPSVQAPITENIDDKQLVNIITAETGVKSNENSDIEYALDIKYDHFSYKYGPSINFDGPKANIVNGSLLLAKTIATNQKIGIKAGGVAQSVGDIKFPVDETTNFHSLLIMKANPYYQIDGGDVSLSIGANINYALDINDKFLISPTLNASWLFNDKSNLYLNVDGGINDNSLVSVFRENKYVDTNTRIDISQTLYDAQIGLKTGSVDGLEFGVHGGYKYTKDEHLFNPSSNNSWANVSAPIYANIGTGNIGAIIKTYLIPYTDISVEANGYFYNLSRYTSLNSVIPTEKKAWGLPTLKFDANIDFTFIPNMVLSVNYNLEAGRKSYIAQKVVDMKNINELNVRAIYNFTNNIAVYGRVTNILNQKYEKYYGYTIEGTNVLGGVSLKF